MQASSSHHSLTGCCNSISGFWLTFNPVKVAGLTTVKARLQKLPTLRSPPPDHVDMIGDVFAKFFGSVDLKLEEVYASFLHEFPIAIDTFFKVMANRACILYTKPVHHCVIPFQLMKNDDAFLAYHSSISASHPEVHNLSLASFLLTPVQRLPRYMLLLREFTKVRCIHQPALPDGCTSWTC
jgi:hypothetical protein